MPSKTIDTMEGEVSYETVTCLSCEDEVLKTEATRCVIGDARKSSRSYKTEFAYRDGHREHWLCEHCTQPDEFLLLSLGHKYEVVLDAIGFTFTVLLLTIFAIALLLL